jgi:hypothetical protein
MSAAVGSRPWGVDEGQRESRPQLRSRDHLLTMLFSAWMIFGLFLDGWAHSNIIDDLESFFTPWHGVFYSGFLATAAWISYQVVRFQARGGRLDRSRVPVGYGLGAVGVALFGLGGIGDMLWHLAFGIEADIEALLSPTHLLLFVSSLLILTSPVRAAWHSDERVDGSFRTFLPVLLSMALTTASVGFFFSYLSPFTEFYPTAGWERWAAGAGDFSSDVVEMGRALSVGQHIVTTLILIVPLIFLLRRWRLPFGTATTIFTTTAFGLSAMEALEGGEMVLAALLGGLGTDLLVRLLRPGHERPWRLRAVASLGPGFLWLANFVVVDVVWGIGWSVHLWTGTVCVAMLTGLAVAWLATPPHHNTLCNRRTLSRSASTRKSSAVAMASDSA